MPKFLLKFLFFSIAVLFPSFSLASQGVIADIDLAGADNALYNPVNKLMYISYSDGIAVFEGTEMIYSIPLEGRVTVVNTKNGYVYVIKYKAASFPDAAGTLYLVQGTEVIKRVGFVGKFPFSFAVNPETGYFYVGRNSCPVCLYIPPYTRFLQTVKDDELSVKVPVGDGAWGMGVEPTTGYLYVANYFDRSISIIQETTNIGTIMLSSNPARLAVNPNNGRVYVPVWDRIAVIEGKELVSTMMSMHYTVYDGTDIAVEPNSGYIYAVGATGVDVYDEIAAIGYIQLSDRVYRLINNPNNGLIYALMFDNLAVIQSTNIMTEIPVGRITQDYYNCLAVDPERGLVYVTSQGDNKVTIVGEIE